MITTGYGSWYNHTGSNTSPAGDVLDAINGGDNDWQRLMEESGALDRIETEYYHAVQNTLPDGIWLTGEEFIGRHESDPLYTDELAEFDIGEAVRSVDLYAIIERHEPWTIDQVAKHLGVQPSSARGMLSRWGVKAAAYLPVTSTRPQAIYDAAEVMEAQAERPGRGKRTDLQG